MTAETYPTLSSSTRVLITGATGALGNAVVDYLLHNTACQVIAIGRNPPPQLAVADNNRLTYQRCDFSDEADIVRVLSIVAPDLVMHFAATFDDDLFVAQQINYQLAEMMLNWLHSHRRSTRVLLIGTAAEYGVVSIDENPVNEMRALRPVSVYGHTKACQTQLVSYYAQRGVHVVMGRIFNLIGSGLSRRLFIGKVHQQIAEIKSGQRQRLEVGSLSASRDYLPINMAITQLMVIARFGIAGEVYHVASGQAVTMRDLLSQELVKNGLNFSFVEEAAALTNRVGYDVPVIYADIKKTIQLILQYQSHV